MSVHVHPGAAPRMWWERAGLKYMRSRLTFAGRDVVDCARPFSDPVFLYDATRPVEKVEMLREALISSSIDPMIFFAMKANRFEPLITHLAISGRCGIDACSINELRHALRCGFRSDSIVYTSHILSTADAQVLATLPEVTVNCDSMSAIETIGRVDPGRRIGIRINPGAGASYQGQNNLSYAGERTTKFGIYRENFQDALQLARKYGLRVAGLHCHAGCGFLNDQLPAVAETLNAYRWFADQVPGLEVLNIGGGLGVPHRRTDEELDLKRWAQVVAENLGDYGVRIAVEPGDFIVKDSGLLILTAIHVEEKRDTLFVGTNGGFYLAMEPAFYGLPCEPVVCVERETPRRRYTIAGNVNEALDVWAEDIELPHIEPGDRLALINAGGYASSMSSNHCAHPSAHQMLLV